LISAKRFFETGFMTMTEQRALVGGNATRLQNDDGFLSPREDLIEDFTRQADWRRRTAKKYPEDSKRNLDAAEIFDRLANTVSKVPEQLLLEYDQLLDDQADDELHDSQMKTVGFRAWPGNAEAFIRNVIAKSREKQNKL
jgi:hypothetical protein